MGIDPDHGDMEEVVARDQRALARLYDRHAPWVHAFIYRMLRDASMAEDVTQEAFVRVWRNAHRWDGGRASFRSWLGTIAANLARDALRKRRDVTSDQTDLRADPSPWANPGRALEMTRAQQILHDAIGDLPERQRCALLLTWEVGLSNAEAGRSMSISEQAMESLLARARRSLRAKLAGCGEDLIGSIGDD